MSEIFPASHGPAGGEPEPVGYLDPSLEREEARRRWTLRTAQWRARHLAEMVFGGEVSVRLQPAGPGAPPRRADPTREPRTTFHGILHVDVPFVDLEVHRFRETVFTACAARDPVLSEVPFVYVFAPAPVQDEADIPSGRP